MTDTYRENLPEFSSHLLPMILPYASIEASPGPVQILTYSFRRWLAEGGHYYSFSQVSIPEQGEFGTIEKVASICCCEVF